ncbi:MAG: type II toxin-antitoxin system HicB family antitoxin [Syntrophobacteraceae bacterium]
MKIAYQAVIEEDEHGFFVQFPDLAEAHTDGQTMVEALFNAEEVLNLTLEGRMEEGMEIPEAQEHEGGVWIYPSAQIQAALLIRRARAGRKTLAELARALETSWPSAQQLENPKHSPSLKRLDRAAAALGKRLVLSVEPDPEPRPIRRKVNNSEEVVKVPPAIPGGAEPEVLRKTKIKIKGRD